MSASKISCAHAHHTGSAPSKQVQTLEETIGRLQEDNAQNEITIRKRYASAVTTRSGTSSARTHAKTGLEANAREQGRERECQQRMNDINLVL